MTPTFKIITNDEWISMRSAWLQQRDAWLAKYEGQISPHDCYFHTPEFYTTRCDGLPHPCDTPGITPQQFLLAVMRDPAIPLNLRVDVAMKIPELWPGYLFSDADLEILRGIIAFVQSGMLNMAAMEETTIQ